MTSWFEGEGDSGVGGVLLVDPGYVGVEQHTQFAVMDGYSCSSVVLVSE